MAGGRVCLWRRHIHFVKNNLFILYFHVLWRDNEECWSTISFVEHSTNMLKSVELPFIPIFLLYYFLRYLLPSFLPSFLFPPSFLSFSLPSLATFLTSSSLPTFFPSFLSSSLFISLTLSISICCLIRLVTGSVRIRYKSSSLKPLRVTLMGRRPCMLERESSFNCVCDSECVLQRNNVLPSW